MTAATLTNQVTQIKIETEQIKKTVCEHDEFINGNGKPGAKVEIANLKSEIKTIGKEVGEIKDMISALQKWAMGILASVIVSIIVYVLINVV